MLKGEDVGHGLQGKHVNYEEDQRSIDTDAITVIVGGDVDTICILLSATI